MSKETKKVRDGFLNKFLKLGRRLSPRSRSCILVLLNQEKIDRHLLIFEAPITKKDFRGKEPEPYPRAFAARGTVFGRPAGSLMTYMFLPKDGLRLLRDMLNELHKRGRL